MIAFAGNSLLTRMALRDTPIDAATFTTVRLVSGALTLWLVVRVRRGKQRSSTGSTLSALALFAYAAGFSFAYANLPAGTGALLLFGAVQVTMVGYGVWAGERLIRLQLFGLLLAFGGLLGLVLPGTTAPSTSGSVLMVGAGIAWGIYSLRGKNAGDSASVTAGNFLRTVPLTAALSAFMYSSASLDAAGIWYGVLSGALASGLGYAIWYTIVPMMRTTHAATVQLSVPVIAALGGVVFLGESLTFRMLLASVAILGGIALVIFNNPSRRVR